MRLSRTRLLPRVSGGYVAGTVRYGLMMDGVGRGRRRSSLKNRGPYIRVFWLRRASARCHEASTSWRKRFMGPVVPGQTIVAIMALQDSAEPSPLISERDMHPPPHFETKLFGLADHSFPLCLPSNDKPSVQGLVAVVREAQEVERFGTPQSPFCSALGSEPAEHQQPGLVLVQRQPELGQSLLEGRHHPARIALVLEAHHKVVGVADHDHASARLLTSPLMTPEIQD